MVFMRVATAQQAVHCSLSGRKKLLNRATSNVISFHETDERIKCLTLKGSGEFLTVRLYEVLSFFSMSGGSRPESLLW